LSASVPALSARDLTVHFGDRAALSRVTLAARPGELVALVGPNGSGKTTLLRCALALQTPTSGAVEVFGREAGRISIRERARQVAWVPQDEAPRDNVRLDHYVLYGRYAHLAPFGGETAEDRAIADRALVDVGLWDRRHAGILELSGGERQRLLLARALSQGSPLLLLDEPTAHLDIGHQLDLLARVRDLVRTRGVCAVAALHDLNLAARFADRLAVLSHGRLVADGPPSAVLSPAVLREVWGIDAEIRRDPATGQPYLLPRRVVEPGRALPAAPPTGPPIHLVGGGGSAAGLLRRLVEEGFPLTAGVLPLLDSDAEACEELGVPYVGEIPFAPISEASRERHRRQLAEAGAVVVAPFAVGPSNLSNLADLEGLRDASVILLLEPPRGASRDFTGGAATRILEGLRARGATTVADATALVAALRARRPPGS
jgi:iron complex transport system ATP-binding protein